MTSLNIETLSSTEKTAVVTSDPQMIESTAARNDRRRCCINNPGYIRASSFKKAKTANFSDAKALKPLVSMVLFVKQRHRRKQISREAVVSWLFLIGSLMFVLDAVLENTRGISFSSLLHLLASILFTIGSVLFIPNDSQA